MREIRTSGSTRGGAPSGPLLLYRLGNRLGRYAGAVLEHQLQGELNLPGRVSVGDLPE